MVPEIRVEGGVKKSCHLSRGGGVDFFWNNPLYNYNITSCKKKMKWFVGMFVCVHKENHSWELAEILI